MAVSRQRRWQMKKNEQGLCSNCGKRPHRETSTICDHCTVKIREYHRKRFGYLPHAVTGVGRAITVHSDN